MRRFAALLIVPTLVATMLSAQSGLAASTTFHVGSSFIRDSFGRTVILHGVNAVWKLAPYYPPSSLYSSDPVDAAHSYFDDRDGALLESLGFNTVRLGVIWKAVEPTRGSFDGTYLDHIAAIVDMLAAHHITVLLDFHQDMWNEAFQGEGAPDWATYGTELKAMAQFGFSTNYFTPPVGIAFDALWLNRGGIADEYANAWAFVAHRFKDTPNVIGYDLLNEPWPGSQWQTCANPAGCPIFQRALLQPFMEKIAASIRAASGEKIVFWEPDVTNDFGAGNWVGLGIPFADPNNAISFHDYCLVGGQFVPGLSRDADPECPVAEQLAFNQQSLAAQRNGSAELLSEFGASDESGDLNRVLTLADTNMVGWQYWSYGNWRDPTGNDGGEGLFTNDLNRFDSASWKSKVALLERPYPQAIAGSPVSYSFDGSTFNVSWTPDGAIDSSAHPTEIFVPDARFPSGYTVSTVRATQIACPDPRPNVLCFQNQGTDAQAVMIDPK
ncbi:MAG: cellulase family glycosylhydrolase [Actinomycetota bacterium]